MFFPPESGNLCFLDSYSKELNLIIPQGYVKKAGDYSLALQQKITGMFGRRHYRIKVLHALYAWYQGGEDRMDIAEKNLLHSIEKFTELYYLLLSFYIELVDFYRRRMEDAKNKFLPTEDELNPNTKFLKNRMLEIILNNKELQHMVHRYKISWTEEQEMIRILFLKMRNSKDLKEYLGSGNSSFKEDKEIVHKLFRKYIARSAELKYYCEDRSIHWNNDFELASIFIQKTLQLVPEQFSRDDSFPGLLSKEDDNDPAGNRRFIIDLFRKTLQHSEEFDGMIEGKTKNWEIDRIALTDIILIKMALTELMHFPTIPVKVTLNEYIDISKNYSTPKSRLFINGILDKLTENLKQENKIKKTGRGLLT
jgi:transcription antitermination protein NusB